MVVDAGKDFLLREAGFPFISDGNPGLSGHFYHSTSCGKVGREGVSRSRLVWDRRKRDGSSWSFSFPFLFLWGGRFGSFLWGFGLSSLDVLRGNCKDSNARGVYKGGDHVSHYGSTNAHCIIVRDKSLKETEVYHRIDQGNEVFAD